jgi:hypothetical protein
MFARPPGSLGQNFCCFACFKRPKWDNQGFFLEKAPGVPVQGPFGRLVKYVDTSESYSIYSPVQTPKSPNPRPVPPRFGREHSRDFPDPDWAEIGKISGIPSYFPAPLPDLAAGNREIGESRFGRDRGNSRDLRLD